MSAAYRIRRLLVRRHTAWKQWCSSRMPPWHTVILFQLSLQAQPYLASMQLIRGARNCIIEDRRSLTSFLAKTQQGLSHKLHSMRYQTVPSVHVSHNGQHSTVTLRIVRMDHRILHVHSRSKRHTRFTDRVSVSSRDSLRSSKLLFKLVPNKLLGHGVAGRYKAWMKHAPRLKVELVELVKVANVSSADPVVRRLCSTKFASCLRLHYEKVYVFGE